MSLGNNTLGHRRNRLDRCYRGVESRCERENVGQLSDAEAAPLLGQAIEKTTLKYGNVPAAPGG
jgi:hypothetical protein